MYETLMYIHLATVVPCVFIGAALFIMKKGTPIHKMSGRVYMILMLITATVTLFMPAKVGGTILNHFGFIHLFSLLTFQSIPRSYFAIKKGNVKAHRNSMIGLYVGAILIAGAFTFTPGRYLHTLFFG